jgi:hypothetical protein
MLWIFIPGLFISGEESERMYRMVVQPVTVGHIILMFRDYFHLKKHITFTISGAVKRIVSPVRLVALLGYGCMYRPFLVHKAPDITCKCVLLIFNRSFISNLKQNLEFKCFFCSSIKTSNAY